MAKPDAGEHVLRQIEEYGPGKAAKALLGLYGYLVRSLDFNCLTFWEAMGFH